MGCASGCARGWVSLLPVARMDEESDRHTQSLKRTLTRHGVRTRTHTHTQTPHTHTLHDRDVEGQSSPPRPPPHAPRLRHSPTHPRTCTRANDNSNALAHANTRLRILSKLVVLPLLQLVQHGIELAARPVPAEQRLDAQRRRDLLQGVALLGTTEQRLDAHSCCRG